MSKWRLTQDEREWEAELLSYGDMDPGQRDRVAKLVDVAKDPSNWYRAPALRSWRFHLRNVFRMR